MHDEIRLTNKGTPRQVRPRDAPPLMDSEELLLRLDGRQYIRVEEQLGAPRGQVSRWVQDDGVPEKWVSPIRARYPRPDEDRFEAGRLAGYRQAVSDMHLAIGDLKP